jgi:formylglycine-generating enzyme required for sulfatase activity
MGSESGRPDERPAHAASVRSFHLGRTPVTNAQYAPFVEAGRAPAPPWWHDPAFCGADLPVVGVTWFEAVAFAEWLGQERGGRWRLPTEAEWERAMRGGLEGSATAWGAALPADEVPEGPLLGPWPVGRGTPNAFGLLDPGTIVHEWCADVYAPYAAAAADRVHPAGCPPPRRASRGGSWRHRQRWSPPSARSSLLPDLRYADYGFRVLREEA